MNTYELRELRARLGAIVRGVAKTGEEAIVADGGSDVAVIISLADYERLRDRAAGGEAPHLHRLRDER
ncbi:type II toxin-antitoxin system Phd/YefM family antitoxin [Nocardia sp. CDC153]|uniref:type II toxin-antitoxin system Phd/YefM family antitoxin n=1 Tax=Nocardia sp. CDC153 TaxID=3112167 RepID=UPI002DB92D60|nr:type II toxin-antitoxin system Phd/YefM family antitoxin [Nocardia sp. CDC153]MEC3958458.1 type II toxin-antitoxin system Phd/YefM family antitoxin [Nocardia sp. CDC153]